MKLICHDEEGRKIYEDGSYWIWKNDDKKSKTLKKDSPLFPFFAITKWRYKVDDKEIFDELKKEYEKTLVY